MLGIGQDDAVFYYACLGELYGVQIRTAFISFFNDHLFPFQYLYTHTFLQSCQSCIEVNIHQQPMNTSQIHNSFSKKPVFTQIIAYAVVVTSLLIYTVSIQPHFINNSLRFALNLLYYLSFTAVLTTAVLTSCSDPSDRMLRKEKEVLQRESLSNAFYCQFCRGVVAEKTRHCRICNICVAGFDHHCIWINNCIGQENYKIFIAMLLLVCANFALFQISLLLLWLESSWLDYLPSMIANWAFAVILLVFLLLLLALTLFHFFLIYADRTTYEHIVMSKRAIIAPDHSRKVERAGEQQPQRDDNSVTKLVTFKTETRIPSAHNGSEEQDSRKVRDVLIFQAESHQQNSGTLSKAEEKASQVKSIEGLKVLSLKGIEDQRGGSFEANSRIFIRNKSLNYILGQINSSQPHKINYRSESIKHEKGRAYILQYKRQNK